MRWSRARPVHADGKRAAPVGAVTEDAGSLSSQDGLEDGDVAVRLLSPAADVPVDEDFEADFAALMQTHQASIEDPDLILQPARNAPNPPCVYIYSADKRLADKAATKQSPRTATFPPTTHHYFGCRARRSQRSRSHL